MRRKAYFRSAMLALVSSCCVAATSFAACTNDPDAASKAVAFIGNPTSLFNGPNGPRTSDEIIADVGSFVAANPQALPAVIALLKGASVDQQQSIGTGLGNARDTCVRPDLNFALEIQTQLANSDSTEAQAKFAAVTGVPIRGVAAGGLGGGVSGGAVGGQTNPLPTPGSTSSFQTFTSNSVSNNPTSYFSGAGAGGAGSAGSTTTNNTTIVCTVSSSC